MISKRIFLLPFLVACSADSTAPRENPSPSFAVTMVVGKDTTMFKTTNLIDAYAEDSAIATADELPGLGAKVTCKAVGTTKVWGEYFNTTTNSKGYLYDWVTCVEHIQGDGG